MKLDRITIAVQHHVGGKPVLLGLPHAKAVRLDKGVRKDNHLVGTSAVVVGVLGITTGITGALLHRSVFPYPCVLGRVIHSGLSPVDLRATVTGKR